ncbi:MAG: hypothetical protein EU533_05550 [Promethearchaeota archaeon]|nr:MAG: hypothetical protein EU533_05550 [Candidatus Lokiarchaeota archaeon]
MTALADFFDLIGVIQEILNLSRSIIQKHISDEYRERIYFEIEKIFERFLNQSEIIEDIELNKISFSRDKGFNIIHINPTNCDPLLAKRILKDILQGVIYAFKNVLGEEKAVSFFRKGGIFNYIYNNLKFIKNLKIDHFLIRLLLLID